MTARMAMTAEQFDALPEEEIRNWELLDGELIEVPSATPLHNRILMRLSRKLDEYAERMHLGAVLPETDLAVGKDSRLRPDFGFFSAKTWSTVDLTKVSVVQTPDIAIEIISPSETIATMQRKVEAYLKWGVHEVWLIPEINTLFIHTLAGAQRLSEGAYPYIPGWQLQVGEIFETSKPATAPQASQNTSAQSLPLPAGSTSDSPSSPAPDRSTRLPPPP
jgi:Uma2 family endonuclease